MANSSGRDVRDYEIVLMVDDGHPITAVAREFNLSNQRISQIVREKTGKGVVAFRGHMANPRYISVSITAVTSLWRSGFSAPMIAKELGVGEGVVYNRLHNAGIWPAKEANRGQLYRIPGHGNADRGREPGSDHPHHADDGGPPTGRPGGDPSGD